jgi:hypothetical protein
MANGSMRDQMPTVAAWIDQLRDAFGKESIDAQIRAGMRGKPVFFAQENGQTVGTPSPARTRVQWDRATGRPYVVGERPAGEQDEQTTKYAERQRREQAQAKGVK